MMTPYEAQSTVTPERAAPYPNEPDDDTSEINIERGYDRVQDHTYEYDSSVISKEVDMDTLRHSIESSVEDLEADVKLRVKNELVIQIYKDDEERKVARGEVDYDKLMEVVRNEYVHQRDSNAYIAQQLTTRTIPAAEQRLQPDLTDHRNFSVRDLPNLAIRAETHHFLDKFADACAKQDPAMLQDLLEGYVAEVLPAARNEVLKIVLAQKRELETQAVEASKRIFELEQTIETLQDEVIDRDIALWEHEVEHEEHLPKTKPLPVQKEYSETK